MTLPEGVGQGLNQASLFGDYKLLNQMPYVGDLGLRELLTVTFVQAKSKFVQAYGDTQSVTTQKQNY